MAQTFDITDEHAYQKARKLAGKAYHSAIARKENPYLEVLDEVCPEHNSLPHVKLDGIVTIPLDRLAGSVSKGRNSAFACNFMPLLDDDTEFALKWAVLHHSVVLEGVREPIKVLEYMNKFYAIEGNKRISVMKFLESPMIEANVTRIIPKRTDEKENIIYFEFLDFYKDTGINFVWFSEIGSFNRLYELVGKEPGVAWTSQEKIDFRAAYVRFSDAYEFIGGDQLSITTGDAFLVYLQVYGYDKESFLVSSELRARLNSLHNEFKTMANAESFSLVMNTQGAKPGLFQQFLRPGSQKLRVAFVNHRSPQVSGWTYWHELGKNRIESVFGDKLETRTINDVDPADCQNTINELIKDGTNIIFTTSPILLDGAMKAAIQHPGAKVLNCSLLPYFHSVRSYYLRTYEAKFIIGAIAGAVCDNNRIGYVADYPVYGMPASINAFALGAKLTNPRAKVYLEWSMVKDSDPMANFAANEVYVISNRDISAPSHQSREFGLYLQDKDNTTNLAMPVWNWGRLYEDLLRRVQNGMWNTDASHGMQALNYWWGMDTEAIDVFYSHKLDSGIRRLADLLRDQLRSGSFKPFADAIVSQDGVMRCAPGKALTPAEIISMDWLADNVIGTIPTIEDMKPEALAFVEKQGIHSIKAPDTTEISWTDPANDGV